MYPLSLSLSHPPCSAVFTSNKLLVVVAELRGEERDALDMVPVVTTALLEEHQLVTGIVVIVDPGDSLSGRVLYTSPLFPFSFSLSLCPTFTLPFRHPLPLSPLLPFPLSPSLSPSIHPLPLPYILLPLPLSISPSLSPCIYPPPIYPSTPFPFSLSLLFFPALSLSLPLSLSLSLSLSLPLPAGTLPVNSRGEKQRVHLRDSFLGDQIDPIYVAYNL